MIIIIIIRWELLKNLDNHVGKIYPISISSKKNVLIKDLQTEKKIKVDKVLGVSLSLIILENFR